MTRDGLASIGLPTHRQLFPMNDRRTIPRAWDATLTRRRAVRVPWLTLVLVFTGVVASMTPELPTALEFSRAAVAEGQIWRTVTGQLVHWTTRMTILDLGTVLILGSWLEVHSRRIVAAIAVASLVLIGLGLFLINDVTVYRGASGPGEGVGSRRADAARPVFGTQHGTMGWPGHESSLQESGGTIRPSGG